MSEADLIIVDRLEKISQAKFSEQKTDLLKSDKDFPIDVIEKLDIPIESRVTVMAAMKEVASRNTESTEKLQKEIDAKDAQLKDSKLSAPESSDPKDGASRVKDMAAKFGLKQPDDTKDGKKD